MTSTIFPFPSSPHCAPTTTMLGMAPSHVRKIAIRRLEHGGDREHPLAAAAEIEIQQLLRPGPRAADDEHVTGALRARVRDRFVEPPADDVSRDRGAAVAQPPRQRQRGGLS